MDLCGGWSDTPPICFDRGGLVVSLALSIDGQVITNHFVIIESMCFFYYSGSKYQVFSIINKFYNEAWLKTLNV